MNLSGIIAISGKPGLYKVVAQGNQSIIVESLLDKKRVAVHSSNKVSSLEDISIYTYDTDVKLSDIYSKIFEKENGGKCISHKSQDAEMRNYLESVLANYDQERVYMSDIKKVFNWYNLLHENDLLIKDEVEETTTAENEAEKPKKKAAAPKKDVTKKAAPSKSTPKASASKAPTKKAPVQRKSS